MSSKRYIKPLEPYVEFTPLHLSSYRKLLLVAVQKQIPLFENRERERSYHVSPHVYSPPRIFISRYLHRPGDWTSDHNGKTASGSAIGPTWSRIRSTIADKCRFPTEAASTFVSPRSIVTNYAREALRRFDPQGIEERKRERERRREGRGNSFNLHDGRVASPG